MKVLHVIDEHEVSGVVNVLCYQNHMLNNSSFEMDVDHCSVHLTKDVQEYFKGWGIDVSPMSGFSTYKSIPVEISDSLRCIRNFVSKVKRLNPDVIHAHAFPASVLVALSSVYFDDISLVYTQHVIRHRANKLEKKIFQKVFSQYDRITCVSNSVKERWVDEFPNTKAKTRVIYNGIPTDYFVPSGENKSATQVVIMSRLVEGRQFLPLLSGFAEANEDDLELLIIGTGPRKDELRKEVNQLGIENSTHFLGFVDDIRQIMSSADIFLFPSGEFEGFGMSVIEAMSMGLPVIAIYHDVLTEIIRDGSNGYLVQPDSNEVADCLSSILKNRNELKRMSENSRTSVVDNFSSAVMNNEYKRLYKSI